MNFKIFLNQRVSKLEERLFFNDIVGSLRAIQLELFKRGFLKFFCHFSTYSLGQSQLTIFRTTGVTKLYSIYLIN